MFLVESCRLGYGKAIAFKTEVYEIEVEIAGCIAVTICKYM